MRPVKVIRYVMKDSLEERMVKLQDAKAALGKGSLVKLTAEERKLARITALKGKRSRLSRFLISSSYSFSVVHLISFIRLFYFRTDLFQVDGADIENKWEGYYQDEEGDDGSDLGGFIVDDETFD